MYKALFARREYEIGLLFLRYTWRAVAGFVLTDEVIRPLIGACWRRRFCFGMRVVFYAYPIVLAGTGVVI